MLLSDAGQPVLGGDASVEASATFIARHFTIVETAGASVGAIDGAFLVAFDQMDGVVMTNEANMSMPVTRDELRDELAQLEQRVDLRFEQVDQRFEQVDQRFEQVDQRFEQISGQLTKMATKVELELWGGALMARIEQSEKRLMTELARHTQANHEASLRLLAAIDDKYTDLPGRVSRLEGTVFPHDRR
jgi:TolA-binding protein